MKRPLFIITLVAYVAILLIDTAQLVGLYRDLVGETLISPWLSLFALNLIVLLLSFHKPEWPKTNPAGVFAAIIGILHLIFFINQIELPHSVGTEFWLQILPAIFPAILFSIFFAYAIYFLADRIASMSEEMAKTEEESRKAFEERIKKEEKRVKTREEAVKTREEAAKGLEDKAKERDRKTKAWRDSLEQQAKGMEELFAHREEGLKERERALNEKGRKVSYGNGFVKVDWSNGKVSVKKLVNENGK